MALAQKPELLILDEPTTFLDISHQLEVMELISKLNREDNITILMVLHDINHAARYSDELIVIKEGSLYAKGEPWEMLNSNMLQEVFNVEAVITEDEEVRKPIFYAKRVING
jgi:iron complex transport system ATP-binding protein